MINGGRAFVKKFAENVCKQVEVSREPVFIVQTEWYTAGFADIFRSMGIQWQPKNNRWHIISAPMRYLPLSQILHRGAEAADALTPVAAAEGEGVVKRVFCFNIEDEKKLSYYLRTDDELVQLLKSSFELEVWTSGQMFTEDNLEFECDPKLFTVSHTSQLKRVYCNIYTFAQSVHDWEQMIRCFVKIIKLLTPDAVATQTATMENEELESASTSEGPATKRQKVE